MMGLGKGLPPPRQRRIRRRRTSKAALILAASFLLFVGALTAQASEDGAAVVGITATAEKSTTSGNTPTADHKAPGDGSAYVEITATLEKGTTSGDQPTPKPKPTGGGGGSDDDHHHHDDDDDTPPKRTTPESETPSQPVVPVVYLPGPGITKVKAVPVPGEPEIRNITRTVTGNESILPEPRKPVEISVSGNGGAKGSRIGIAAVPRMDGTHEEGKNGQWVLIGLLILLFFLVLAAWYFIARKTGKSRADKPHDSSEDHEF